MPEVKLRSINRSIENVINFGDTDIFPFPFENILIRRKPEDFATIVSDILERFSDRIHAQPPQFVSLLVPTGYQGYRWATQIDPFWNAAFLSMTIELFPKIESARLPSDSNIVHSYRMNKNSREPGLFDERFGWQSFMRTSHAHAQNASHVIVTDISEFYRRIYHHKVENAIQQLTDSSLSKNIIGFLGNFSNGASYGIPIGGPASRILSELTINQIDQILFSHRIKFCRFSDDYHIFSESEGKAHTAIQLLSELLIRNQGLTLQKSKTRILSSNEFIQNFPKYLLDSPEISTPRDRLFHISLNFDPYSPTAAEDYENLKKEVDSIDFLSLLDDEAAKSQIHAPTVNRLIKALKAISPQIRKTAIKTIFENINTFFPVFSHLLIVLNSMKNDLEEDEYYEICKSLIGLIEEKSFIMELDLHKSFALRMIHEFKDPRISMIFSDWFRNSSPIVRRDILLSYGKTKSVSHLSDIKTQMTTLTPWERRAFIASSYSLKDEGRHWRDHQKFDEIEKFTRDGINSVNQEKKFGELL